MLVYVLLFIKRDAILKYMSTIYEYDHINVTRNDLFTELDVL